MCVHLYYIEDFQVEIENINILFFLSFFFYFDEAELPRLLQNKYWHIVGWDGNFGGGEINGGTQIHNFLFDPKIDLQSILQHIEAWHKIFCGFLMFCWVKGKKLSRNLQASKVVWNWPIYWNKTVGKNQRDFWCCWDFFFEICLWKQIFLLLLYGEKKESKTKLTEEGSSDQKVGDRFLTGEARLYIKSFINIKPDFGMS